MGSGYGGGNGISVFIFDIICHGKLLMNNKWFGKPTFVYLQAFRATSEKHTSKILVEFEHFQIKKK